MQAMIGNSAFTPSGGVSDNYHGRNYAEVVRSLDPVPRHELLRDVAQSFMLADSLRRLGEVLRSLELTADIVTVAREQERLDVLCDALNLHGILLLESGHGNAAERAWCELVIVASQVDNSQYVARASNNLGVTAILAMRLEDALASFQRSVAAYLRLGYSRGLSQSHLNLGIVFREMNHEHESHAHFQRALTWAYAADCLDEVARAEQETALLQVYVSGDLEGATGNAQLAMQRFTELNEPAGVAESLKVLGIIALARRDPFDAERYLDKALGIARDRGLRVLEAETLLALSALERHQHRGPQSYQHEQQARLIFADMDAAPWGEQVLLRMKSLGTAGH